MTKQILHTVEGLRDIHPLDTRKKQHIEQQILNVFNQYGYEQVQTPMFEYFDIYHYERGTQDSKNLYKFFNREGDILSLRPDVTPSIARYTATFYNHERSPKRFSYLGNVFYNNENYQGKLREYTQAGVECIGIGNADADAESIALAINALLATGLQEFQLDIGHAGFFKGLAAEAGLSDELREEVRSLIDAKNYIALEELLEDLKIESAAKNGLLELPKLFGQEEVLARAKELTTNTTALEAIERIKEVYNILKEYKLSSYVSFDLGMVSQLQYYTGIIFKGFTYGTGVSVVDGGRYDALLSTFAYDMPAVGFAIRIDELLSAIMRQMIAIDVPSTNTLIVYNKAYRKTAIELAQVLRRQKMTVELDTKNQALDIAKEYGKNKNIGGIMYINAADTVELINLSTDETNTVNLSDLSKGGL
ncbi:ATP phosphoribosyltransferase regulatory subunit [Vallitaleaceae bacterium 9-2]